MCQNSLELIKIISELVLENVTHIPCSLLTQENHRRELEENNSDMMMVLQALKSDSYQTSSMPSESIEMNDELKKLERYVETLKKEHKQEIERLNQVHEDDLEQLRSDMVTLLRVQDSYKTPEDEKVRLPLYILLR